MLIQLIKKTLICSSLALLVACGGEDGGGDCDYSDTYVEGFRVGMVNQHEIEDEQGTVQYMTFILVYPYIPQVGQSIFQLPTISLFPQAHALSCAPQPLAESITSVEIISDSDFSAEYPAGDDLSELFEIQSNPRSDNRLTSEGLSLHTEHRPTAEQTHNLKVLLGLDSGAFHEFSVEELNFADESFH